MEQESTSSKCVDVRRCQESLLCVAHAWLPLYTLKGLVSDSTRYQNEVLECSAHSSHNLRVKVLGIKDPEDPLIKRKTLWETLREESRREKRKHEIIQHSSDFGLSLRLRRSVHGDFTATPHRGLNKPGRGCLDGKSKSENLERESLRKWTDVYVSLQLLLQRLEESRPASARDQEQVNVDQTLLQPEMQRDVREYLSARDLKTVRQDSKRYSGCFGSRLDRIGFMSSLGCNTARRTNRLVSTPIMWLKEEEKICEHYWMSSLLLQVLRESDVLTSCVNLHHRVQPLFFTYLLRYLFNCQVIDLYASFLSFSFFCLINDMLTCLWIDLLFFL